MKLEALMSAVTEIRPSPIAGTWYTAQPKQLAQQMDEYLQRASLPKLPGEVLALLAPHAGHRYSGPVAGYAFATLENSAPEVVAILGPMHAFYPQPFLTSAHAAYSTPLGDIQINRPLVNLLDGKLKERLGVGLTPVVNDPEHALEIELPFLQRAVKSTFTLLPIMLRAQTPENARALGEALAETLAGQKAVLVASSDLSHFHNRTVASRLDAAMLAQVAAFSPEGLFAVEASGQGEACGLGALAAVMWAAKALGAKSAKVLKYATSGEASGDFQQVVGYGAAVFCGEAKIRE
jgi:AmmeMemoRadiSam system protein B